MAAIGEDLPMAGHCAKRGLVACERLMRIAQPQQRIAAVDQRSDVVTLARQHLVIG